MLAFAGVTPPNTVQGRSFKSLLETGKEPEKWKQQAYYRYWMHMAHHDNPGHLGIRTKTHKLIYYYGCNYQGENQTPPGWELYDLIRDPNETVNLYHDQSMVKLVSDLKQRLAETRIKIGDDGSHFPKCEAILQEFWDYDDLDQLKAREISHQFLQRRLLELNR